jgi:hypothetical protein
MVAKANHMGWKRIARHGMAKNEEIVAGTTMCFGLTLVIAK